MTGWRLCCATPGNPTDVMRAKWAANPACSRGREHAEAPVTERSEYGRDRDRIVHSSAFRRLEYKTQVFINHEGDLFRTRLTHSIEVAQIARSIARAIGADEDLTEAIALAHDLGHTPFGHAGQEALNACMRDHDGFEHNLQSLRVVRLLEERYAAFDGLNLTFETHEGILKHVSQRHATGLGPLGARFLEGRRPSVEAQIANIADEIAYNNHDVDDGLRSGLLTLEQLEETQLVREHLVAVRSDYPALEGRRLIHETIRRMINAQVVDLIATTRARLAEVRPCSIDDVRMAPPLVAFSDAMQARTRGLKAFLMSHLYRHWRVLRMTTKAQRIVGDLFNAFISDARLLPDQHLAYVGPHGNLHRVVADYIAGMTDRYAIQEHRRLFDIDSI